MNKAILKCVQTPACALFVAILWRLILFAPGYTPDSDRFISQADTVLNGGGYPITSLPPGYPIFLAICRVFTLSLPVLRALQFALSIASCLLVYLAIARMDKRYALWSLWAIALHPLLARHTGYLLSETFAVFIASLIVYLASHSLASNNNRIDYREICLGFLLAFLPLTVPGTLMLVAFLMLALMWGLRFRRVTAFAVVLGFAVPMAAWQLNCISQAGRVQPLLISGPKEKMSSGFAQWNRTWLLHEKELYVWWDDGETIEQLPDSVFIYGGTREELIAAWRRYKDNAFVQDPQFEEAFRGPALKFQQERPIAYHVLLPLTRALYLWIDMPQLGHFDAGYIDHILPSKFAEVKTTLGVQTALLRWIKAFASLFVYSLFVLYPIALLILAGRSLRYAKIVPLATILGVVAYTLVSSYFALGEVRRNLPFIPFLLFLTYFSSSSRQPIAKEEAQTRVSE